MNGVFITFEGGDGVGKSTHCRILAKALESEGRHVICLREPGGTTVGEALRQVVLDPAHTSLSSRAELFIYEAARAQLVSEVIQPALEQGSVVLCDRFYDSTIAYQAYGRGLDRGFVCEANRFACHDIRPDRTVLMRVANDAAKGLQRAATVGTPDRMESAGLDFHERVARAFQALETYAPDRIRVVDSDGDRSDTARAVFEAVADVVGWNAHALPFSNAFFEALDEGDDL